MYVASSLTEVFLNYAQEITTLTKTVTEICDAVRGVGGLDQVENVPDLKDLKLCILET